MTPTSTYVRTYVLRPLSRAVDVELIILAIRRLRLSCYLYFTEARGHMSDQAQEQTEAVAAALLQEWAVPGRIGAPPQSSDAAALSLPPLSTLEAALAVNRAMASAPRPNIVRLRDALGGHVGWKMGWKDAFADRPVLCGPLFGCGLIAYGRHQSTPEVSLSTHRAFCAEAEFCLILRRSLPPLQQGQTYTEEQVWEAVDRVELWIELCGARQFISTNKYHYVADALCSAAVVRGPCIGKREDIDPATLTTERVELFCGTKKISEGTARNNPGDSPLASLTILANELCGERGMTLEAGAVVICGHCCQAQLEGRPKPNLVGTPRPEWGSASWGEGDELRAKFGTLGEVKVALKF